MNVQQRPSGLRFLENLAYLVPGYEGYKRREMRQEEDSRLRARVHGQLLKMRTSLELIQTRWSQESRGGHREQLNQCRLRLQSIADAVRYSPYGFRGFFDAESVDEQLLEKVLVVDLLILEDLEMVCAYLTRNDCSISTAPRTCRSFFRTLDTDLGQLECHLIMREKILASAGPE